MLLFNYTNDKCIINLSYLNTSNVTIQLKHFQVLAGDIVI